MTSLAARSPRLVARTVRLAASEAPDLVAVAGEHGYLWEHDGAGLAGRGEVLRLRLPRGLRSAPLVAEALAAIDADDEVGLPGTGPVALAALPFDPHRPGELVVPEVVVGRAADGTSWLTTVGVGRAPALGLDALAPPARVPAPDRFTLAACRPHDEWCDEVAGAVEAVRAGELEKVVLAREVMVEANRDLSATAVLRRVRALYPSCMLFSVDGFVGASPELLVARFGLHVRSHPLAGTVSRSGDAGADEALAAAMLASPKERREHRVVVDAVAAALAPVCAELDVPDEPSFVHLRNVTHLGTPIGGTLAAPPPGVLELVARLHPTPAVGGAPTDAALRRIAAAEGFDRGRYAGPVGWVDARGDGQFALGIRSAELDGPRARLLAGVGIVEGSDPEAELVETQLKLQALLAAVVRP